MKNFWILEALSTKYFQFSISTIIVLTPLLYIYFINWQGRSINDLSIFIDLVLKTLAFLIGALWVLNRYYTQRPDK
jgi:hypothetical protein